MRRESIGILTTIQCANETARVIRQLEQMNDSQAADLEGVNDTARVREATKD